MPESSGVEEVLICFSHLRWDFVYQRPQHLLTRAARRRKVYFLEEPVWTAEPDPASPRLSRPDDAVTVLTPSIDNARRERADEDQRDILNSVLRHHAGSSIIAWYYTPMALSFSEHLRADVTVYDCMDELSAFRGAPPRLVEREQALFRRADLVFTGGRSLYEAKRGRHPDVRPFPSSIDKGHFAPARIWAGPEPADQAPIGGPRIGFFGVIDERMDLDLVEALAASRPGWQFVLIGPVVKIDPANLPRRDNIHWLGQKRYADLPAYLAGWSAAFMPFALNESTRFISPTKTPEFLAAGVPVVSTPVRDVVDPYGNRGLAGIARDAAAFASALEAQMERPRTEWLSQVDAFLADHSWDRTWSQMENALEEVKSRRAANASRLLANREALHV